MFESGASSADAAGVRKSFTHPKKWKFDYSLLRGDFTPGLTFSLIRYLRPFSSWQLELLEFLTARTLFLATSTLHQDDIG
jgi:hypothetical protein